MIKGYDEMSQQKIISFDKEKTEVLDKRLKQEHKKELTKIALTSSSPTEYVFMEAMYRMVEASHRIVNNPELREKCKKIYRR